MTGITLGFVPEPITVNLEQILPSRKVPAGLATSRKFRQVMSSIEEVGLIEPLSVAPLDAGSGHHLLLDGHVRLADILDPDSVPNDVGVDPWYAALSSVVVAEGTLPFDLQVFGFRRALGRRSRSVEELLKLTFESLHAAAQSGTFSEHQWRLLESALPWAPFGQEWDAAIRLRRAAARKCAELELRAEGLTQLVRSDELFLQVVAEIWDLWGGPRYLRSVCDALDRSAPRARLLKRFIKQHSKLW